jgi:putative peptidoglycan lipid II flippase
LSITQLVIFILISIASILSVGAISVFQLSHNLQSVPLAIVGMSYSVAAFPTLASFLSKGERQKFKEHIITATKHIIFWSLPAVVLFIVLRAQIVRVLFGSGEFTWADTRLTAAALALFSVSVTAQSLVLLYARGYYAAGNTRTPLIVNALSAGLIILLAFGFLFVFQNAPTFQYFIENLLRVDGLMGTSILMLPLAFSVGMILNASVLIWSFKRDFPMDFSGVAKSFRQGLFGAIFMGAVAYLFLDFLDDFFDLGRFMGIFLQGAIAGLFGIASGVALLWVIDNKEIKVVMQTLHKKFWKAKTLGSSQDDLIE